MRSKAALVLAALSCAAALGGPGLAQEASSENYVLEVSTVTMAGGRSESASYKVADSIGLGTEGGAMESASYKAMASTVAAGDADGDGVADANDPCPQEHSACYDLDGDGCIDVPDVDADTDGVTAGACDCDDGDGSIWGTPGEVLNLRLAKGSASSALLSWDPPAAPGATAPRYDTVRSGSAADFEPGVALCVETDDAADTGALDPDLPAPGGVFHYLVRAENGCASGTGTAGTSRGLYERTVRDCS